ncbi:trifunctional hydroxymethylpyrimidine kinase/phosphomethylpyrimidine kinase/thiaminase [Cladophialophora chaetospira]|uniref:Trifunctional hydroxymethylpyrimidine kinase/phosphomethylpyrimidine kinase/thiaminase n=1 Tax=Cladophialophora chaetospira TaxID=386627 RepID=A0AA39CIN3_9EURO|nr:trifunctional hydroxymethylpyrimidine kinase/phosphomethylpyrimidine kinase/thiaminase [Cladophialophora chaetospira]
MKTARVLVIAGSDSSGGAGLEADQKVLAAHGCYGMTATTALTAQNTLGVDDIHITPPAFVGKQIEACLTDIGCDAVKIGMLASAETVKVVAEALQRHNVSHVVVDPVMVATSGAQLLPGDAVRNLREKLLPLATLLTPNIPEATLLLRDADIQYKSPSNLDDLKNLAKMVHELGPQAVLLKGGHMPLTKEYTKAASTAEKSLTVDILYDGTEYTIIESSYLTAKNTHGTGCSLASAIASNIALQISRDEPVSLLLDVRKAVHYVSAGIKHSDSSLGKGSGPINHFHSLQPLPFTPGHFIDEYLLLHPLVKDMWRQYTHHPFATAMAHGTLPESLFKNYLVQDYLYLTHFARTHALAAYKSQTMSNITASAQIILHIQREMDLHLSYCAEFDISREQLEDPTRTKESLACTAYSRYVLDIGASQDWLALQMALAPCLLGYGMTAERLVSEVESVTGEKGNRYWRWVENYVAEDYKDAVRVGRELIESNIAKQSPSRVEELIAIFVRATEMEVRFWDFDAHSEEQ